MSYNGFVKYFDWSKEKNEKLKKERGINFNDIVSILNNKQFLDVISNPSGKHSNQKVFVIGMNNYIYYVPFIEDKEKFFLKTIIPSRKATKRYLPKK